MKVYKTECSNCLFSEKAIVSPARRKKLIKEITTKGSFFICHRATLDGEKEICCNAFFNKLGHTSQLIRIAQRLNVVEWVEQPEDESGLISWKEMQDEEE